jgi:hypothetical protein
MAISMAYRVIFYSKLMYGVLLVFPYFPLSRFGLLLSVFPIFRQQTASRKHSSSKTPDMRVGGPHFDPETGCPCTEQGESIVAKSWLEEAVPVSGDKDGVVHEHDFRVPYSTIQQATQDFSERARIGGGGSCFVYKGDVYGVSVAIKALKEADCNNEGENMNMNMNMNMMSLESKQFFAEMKLLQVGRCVCVQNQNLLLAKR